MPRFRDARRVFVASLLRDIRTRFGNSYFSYIIAVGWPLTHMVILYGVYVFGNKLAPVGDDPGVFVATGITPYILCLYPARMVALTFMHTRPLLQFPIVRPMHLILSRVILEVFTAFLVLALFVAILYGLKAAVMPQDLYRAISSTLLGIFFGIGIGLMGAVGYAIVKNAAVVIVFSILFVLYISSGVFFPSVFMSENVRNVLWYNPMYHCIGLLRSSYYDTYGFGEFSYTFLFLSGATVNLVGVAGERFLRGKLIAD